MGELLIYGALLLVASLIAGLWRSVIGPTMADRLLAIQLLGTGGVALCVLLMAAYDNPGFLDIALVFALLAAVGAVALTRQHWRKEQAERHSTAPQTVGEKR